MSKIYHGSCLDVIKTFPNDSIDAVVTDPPYELGFMGKKWDNSGIAYNVNLWKEALRVLKPGGHLLAFGGTRTYHRMAVAIEDAGFEVRDMLEWIYFSGFPKSLNIGKAVDKLQGNEREVVWADRYHDGGSRKEMGMEHHSHNVKIGATANTNNTTKGNSEWEGFGTALKPAHEPIILARKSLSEKTIVENVLKHGTGALDIDGCRIPTNTHLTGSDLFDKLEIVLLNNKLCQLNLSHLFVDNAGKKKFPEDTTRKIRNLFSAVGNVDMPTSEKILGKIAEDISKMDTGCFEEMLMESISTSLNTYTSGKNTTEEKSQEDMMSTTSTENEMTIEKKTSNSLQEANTSNSIGRFPANCICTDDALNDGVMTKGELHNKQGTGKSMFLGESYGSKRGFSQHDSGSKSRYFDIDVWAEKYGLLQYPKASKRERNEGCEGLEEKKIKINTAPYFICKLCGKQKISGNPCKCQNPEWEAKEIKTTSQNNHPTVKPVHLMSWLVRLVSREGDTVLDPFTGSGTTGVACKKLNRNFIGIELTEDYLPIIQARTGAEIITTPASTTNFEPIKPTMANTDIIIKPKLTNICPFCGGKVKGKYCEDCLEEIKK